MRKLTYTKANPINQNMKKSFHFENSPIQEKTLKQTKSVSSLHGQANQQKGEILSNKISELRSLTEQKDQLMEELTLLKQGAVNALMEKEQMIDKLKNGFGIKEIYEDQKLQMQKQFNKMKRRIKDLEDDRRELSQKLEFQKNNYFEELYSRDTLIDSLDNRIRDLEEQIQIKSQQNHTLISKLEMLSSENDELLERLEFNQLSQKQGNKSIDICHGLTRAKSEAQIISYLYSDSIHNTEEKAESQENKRLSNLVSEHEQRIQELTKELEKLSLHKYDKQTFQKTLQTQGNDKLDYDNLSVASHQVRKLISLRNDVKDLGSNKREQETESQFSMKYFKYEQKMNHRQINQFEELSIQEEYQIEEQQNQSLLTSRDLFVGMAGGLVGMGLVSFLNTFHK